MRYAINSKPLPSLLIIASFLLISWNVSAVTVDINRVKQGFICALLFTNSAISAHGYRVERGLGWARESEAQLASRTEEFPITPFPNTQESPVTPSPSGNIRLTACQNDLEKVKRKRKRINNEKHRFVEELYECLQSKEAYQEIVSLQNAKLQACEPGTLTQIRNMLADLYNSTEICLPSFPEQLYKNITELLSPSILPTDRSNNFHKHSLGAP